MPRRRNAEFSFHKTGSITLYTEEEDVRSGTPGGDATMADAGTIERSPSLAAGAGTGRNAAHVPSASPSPQRSRPNPAHVIAYRVSIPLLGGRYYLALFSGHEQRRPDRVAAEGQQKPWSHTLVGFFAVIGGISTAVMCTLAAVYLVKTMLGIDLFDGHFFLHDIFFG